MMLRSIAIRYICHTIQIPISADYDIADALKLCHTGTEMEGNGLKNIPMDCRIFSVDKSIIMVKVPFP